jgi:hypothetical protein
MIAWLAAALLACSTEPAALTEQPQEALSAVSAERLHTQEALLDDPNAKDVSGQVICPGAPSGWRIAAYAIPLGDRSRAPDSLPDGPPLTITEADEDGSFSMRVPRGARRLLVGLGADGALAWGDIYGRYTELVTDIVDLSLDCRIHPVPSPDGSRMASQGERVLETNTFELPPEVAAEMEENQAWVDAVPAAPKVDVWSRPREDFGGPETISRIRSRYRNRLTEEELNIMMPMLYQLADQPREADAMVDMLVRQRATDSPRPRDPSLPEIR